ncbi:nucleotidyl transferase AbiEii/AbiGii toxin family protein [Legionella pneumophila]|nr:nucleotidyl transferase AbiEii/AbiGii toxin family protein [Legionella pneumophila]
MNEQSLKAKLKQLASIKEKTFQELWKILALERFLARLAKSNLDDKLVFKGGFLLAQLVEIGRETTDLDFLARNIQAAQESIVALVETICTIELADGFIFEIMKVSDLEHAHMHYPGFRLSLKVQFYSMKDTIQLDIGVGDLVEPIERSLLLTEVKNQALFESEITLLTYPIEFIFAEKLETLVSRGATNSRMKDYHDLLIILRNYELNDFQNLQEVITNTFKHRGTELILPILFDRSEIEVLQSFWKRHINTLDEVAEKLQLPDHIQSVISEINDNLIEIVSK